MILTIILSQRIDCDERAIIKLINDRQLFFIAESAQFRVVLPSKPIDDPLLKRSEIENTLYGKGHHQPPSLDQQHVLLTSRRLVESHSHLERSLTVISDAGKLWMSSNQRSLWFASRIIRSGLGKLILQKCQNKGCICSSDEKFYFLCPKCEKLLRGLDYRDAILHLKDAIQWLNERLSIQTPDLSSLLAPQNAARLRLAGYYAGQSKTFNAFNGKGVLMVLHFLSDLVPFVEALKKMGAEYSDMILIAKPYPYPKRDNVSHVLQSLGVRVYRASKEDPVVKKAREVLVELATNARFKNKKFVVIEDGGYFTPLLHNHEFRQLLKNCIGTVEQTTKGIRLDEDIPKLKIPVLSVAKCNFKSRYEAPEIGRITVQNITRFVPNTKLSGEHAIVIGFGDIGAQVGYQLNKTLNMAVSVVDSLAIKVMEARHRRDFVAEAASRFSNLEFRKRAALVVGTTGKTSIPRRILRQLPDGCIIVSTSSDRIEIDIKALENMAGSDIYEIEEGKTLYRFRVGSRYKTLTLLAEGYPINFYGSESLPNASIDPIMTLLLLCGVELCKGRIKGNIIHEESVNAIVEYYKLIERFLMMSRSRDT